MRAKPEAGAGHPGDAVALPRAGREVGALARAVRAGPCLGRWHIPAADLRSSLLQPTAHPGGPRRHWRRRRRRCAYACRCLKRRQAGEGPWAESAGMRLNGLRAQGGRARRRHRGSPRRGPLCSLSIGASFCAAPNSSTRRRAPRLGGQQGADDILHALRPRRDQLLPAKCPRVRCGRLPKMCTGTHASQDASRHALGSRRSQLLTPVLFRPITEQHLAQH